MLYLLIIKIKDVVKMIKEMVIKAYLFAKEKHSGQTRNYSGFEYFIHPKGVARKIQDLTRDEDMIVAGLLHDVVEDCGVSLDTIKEMFGERVSNLVFEVTTQPYDKENIEKKDMMLAKMLGMSNDALTIKLCDRLDNVQYMDKDCKTIDQKQFVKRYFEETQFIIRELSKLKKDKKKIHNSLIRMIDAQLEYIRIKHLW